MRCQKRLPSAFRENDFTRRLTLAIRSWPLASGTSRFRVARRESEQHRANKENAKADFWKKAGHLKFRTHVQVRKNTRPDCSEGKN
jgi:hypothetical protein